MRSLSLLTPRFSALSAVIRGNQLPGFLAQLFNRFQLLSSAVSYTDRSGLCLTGAFLYEK